MISIYFIGAVNWIPNSQYQIHTGKGQSKAARRPGLSDISFLEFCSTVVCSSILTIIQCLGWAVCVSNLISAWLSDGLTYLMSYVSLGKVFKLLWLPVILFKKTRDHLKWSLQASHYFSSHNSHRINVTLGKTDEAVHCQGFPGPGALLSQALHVHPKAKDPQTRTPVSHCNSTVGLGTQRVGPPGRIKVCGIPALPSPEQMIFPSLNHTISLNHTVTNGISPMYKKILGTSVLPNFFFPAFSTFYASSEQTYFVILLLNI